MKATSVVTIVLEGVPEASVPRLQTAVKTHLVKFARKTKVGVEPEKAAAKPPRKGR